MSTLHRLTRHTIQALLVAQMVVVSVYCFWFVPTFAGGIGPEGETTGGPSDALVVAALAFGVAVVALDAVACRGIARAGRGARSARRPLLVAGAAQALVVVCALGAGSAVAATGAGLLLVLLAAAHLAFRPCAG
ncbi:hypothetical protein [Streptomyces buecherae]|uniref:Uncharacterized protein n=1 Tax=Streptomyces buecherae TaxID=2763006 RepID=A0A7H8NFJ8_9ACTN|nr:hypothetical protein [Streptomyces buecherae]QKW53222.1 hypothetical protein HUT08_30910 [Streptomyces buecherae]